MRIFFQPTSLPLLSLQPSHSLLTIHGCVAILFYRRPALNISPKRTRSSALASPIKMLEENTRGTIIQAIVGDGANLADGISPMRDLESAPQLLKQKTSQASGQVEEPCAWYEKDSKPYMRWSFFTKTMLEENTRGTRIQAIVGDGANLADGISPMCDLESAPQLLNQWPGGRAMYSTLHEMVILYEDNEYLHLHYSILTYQKSRHVRTELPSGSSPTLIGDTPPLLKVRGHENPLWQWM
ncbi:hypothetical protein K439DRAFT_1613923 [Ramaria rubella]|nr:hypothetical protein K439DRAFT_1613923 [Ramaria rubella]